MDKISRNKSNELIMKCIYANLVQNIFNKKIIENIYERKMNDIDDFSKKTISIAIKNKDKIIKILEKKLINWKWERISTISQAILIMSYTHFKYTENIDKSVVIDIAIKLSKKFSDDKEYKFINAVLDKILL